jgi:hypothetical protein
MFKIGDIVYMYSPAEKRVGYIKGSHLIDNVPMVTVVEFSNKRERILPSYMIFHYV